LVDAERNGDALAEAIDDSDDVAVAAITVAELRVVFSWRKGPDGIRGSASSRRS